MTAADREAFERAFVAASYLVGVRGERLIAPLLEPTPAAQRLYAGLSAEARADRARILAGEVARLVRSLEARRLR